MTAIVTTLSNGVRVCNFSSPHAFKFTDGTELPAVPPEVCERLSLERETVETPWDELPGVWAVQPRYGLTAAVMERLTELNDSEYVDVLIVPFPLLETLRRLGIDGRYYKAATIMLDDRVTKTCHIDRFCR